MNERTGFRIFVPLAVGLALAAGYVLGVHQNQDIKVLEGEKDELGKMVGVMNLIESRYVDSVDRERIITNGLNGMLSSLDPHSRYIPAQDHKMEAEFLQGSFVGVGVQFLINRDTLAVTHVLEGGPSERAGLMPGDRIISVDDENIANMGLTDQGVQDRLRGEHNTRVKLGIFRDGKVITKVISRGSVPLSSVDAAYMVDDDIGYVKLSRFARTTHPDFLRAVSELRRKGMRSLILDLRDNGGGLLDQAVSLSDEFLKEGLPMVYTEGLHEPRVDYMATTFGSMEEVPVSVLINSASASASEIVAGALQDNDRAIVVGRRSFGKGLVQQDELLMDGSFVRLTVSRYYTPSGRSIQKPYGEGIDYYNDLQERLESGELLEQDTTAVPDSLIYHTRGGRIVYGGGGIYPDVFVPLDSSGSSVYFANLSYSRVFDHFVLEYLDRHRERLLDKGFKWFMENFQVTEQMFEELVARGEGLSVPRDAYGMVHSKQLIKDRLKAELADQLFGRDEMFAVYGEQDKDISKAKEKLQK